MDKDVLILFISGFGFCVVAGVTGYVMLVQRLSIVETVLKMIGKNAAKALHSPHTPELDALLEKYLKTYTDRHYEMSRDEWKDLKDKCNIIIEDLTISKGERLLAGIIDALCSHKLELPNMESKNTTL